MRCIPGLSSLTVALVLVSCDVADPSKLAYDPSFLTADGLTVTITTSPAVPLLLKNRAGQYTLIAQVSGASGPFLYKWGWRRCNKSVCPPDYAQGLNSGSILYTIGATDWFNDFVVEVRRSSVDQASVGKLRIEGPVAMPEGGTGGNPSPSPTFNCKLPTLGWAYPFEPIYGSCQSLTTSCYRRNPCTGARENYSTP